MKPLRKSKHSVSVNVRALESLLREFDPEWPYLLLETVILAQALCDERTLAASGMTDQDLIEAEEAAMVLTEFVSDGYGPSGGPSVSLDTSTGMLTIKRRARRERQAPTVRDLRPLPLSIFRRAHAGN